MKWILCIFLALGWPGPEGIYLWAEESKCRANKESCEYYLCREKESPCGRRGYTIDLGYRYCQKFLTHQSGRWSKKAKAWIPSVRFCLQESLHQLPLETSCSRVRSKAILQHIACYIEGGFCQLPLQDKKNVLHLIGTKILSPSFLWPGLQVFHQCQKL